MNICVAAVTNVWGERSNVRGKKENEVLFNTKQTRARKPLECADSKENIQRQ